MKTHFTCIVGLILVSLTILNSCKKDDDSAYQPVGNYGNANIVNSEVFTLNDWSIDWLDATNFSYSSYVSWPVITQDILDHGLVMVYWKSFDQWQALPVSYSAASFSTSKNFLLQPGQVIIDYFGYSTFGPDPVSYVTGQQVRIVAVSAQTLAAYPHTDWNNYNEVKQTLQLSDH
jgi:hypothetical protein